MSSFHDNQENDFFYFDPLWYLEQNPELKAKQIDPFKHFIEIGWKEGLNPSKHFDVQQYIEKNPEILPIEMNPFLHIAFTYNNSVMSKISFPTECVETSHEFKSFDKNKKYKRVIIVASFIGNGQISAHLAYLLTKLKKVCDAIILIGDNPILEKEIKKLSNSVYHASFHRHEEYDFGSYKRGLEYLYKQVGLENIEELILCNDSCIGPIFPMEEMFDTMEKRNVDFWGLTASPEVFPHLQSYFMVFNNKVINHNCFTEYFKDVKKEISRSKVILKYELLLNSVLQKAGFESSVYIDYPPNEAFFDKTFKHRNITTAPLYLLAQKSPLIKLKHLYEKSLNYDGLEETFAKIEEINPSLARIIKDFLEEKEKKQKMGNTVEKYTTEPEKRMMYLKMDEEVKFYMENKEKIIGY